MGICDNCGKDDHAKCTSKYSVQAGRGLGKKSREVVCNCVCKRKQTNVGGDLPPRNIRGPSKEERDRAFQDLKKSLQDDVLLAQSFGITLSELATKHDVSIEKAFAALRMLEEEDKIHSVEERKRF